MSISKTAVLAEVIKRKTVISSNEVQLSADFPAQNAFVEDPSRYIAAQCSRRAGKSNGLALRFFKTMERHPKSQCIYLALTRDSAKEILWPVLQEMNDKYKIGCAFTESQLVMKHPNGSTLKLFGADMKNFIKRLKGRKYPGVGVDESQDFGPHLESLIDDVLTPSISDYPDGWIALVGTPGPVPQGYFYQVTQERKFGYSRHAWTLMENPHMPDPQSFLKDLKVRKEWTDENPTLKREWLNQWVLDTNSLWVRYNESINNYNNLPKEHKWQFVMGVDIGFKDADAIAVLAWAETSQETYLVEELITRKQGITELVAQIDSLQKKYGVYKIVMDEGGLGKKIAEEIRRRFSCPLHPADKVNKQDNIEFLNDALRLSKFKAKNDSQFAKDSYLVQIDWLASTPKRIILKKNFHSDIIDAVLYAFRESYAYSIRFEESKKPHWGTKEWAEQQSTSMFEAELEGHTQAEEYSKWQQGKWE